MSKGSKRAAPAKEPASRKRAKASPARKNDRLSEKDESTLNISDLEQENARLRESLTELSAAFEALQNKRQTAPEAALNKLKTASETRFQSAIESQQSYKQEVEKLHADLNQSNPRSQKSWGKQLQAKESEIKQLQKELSQAQKQVTQRDQTREISLSKVRRHV